ncbi:MAG TPA: hypothetical protein VJT84_04465 [Gaiellaceae bacterium]|nr:hypothetical protein [Gaiellaceae bacterium]
MLWGLADKFVDDVIEIYQSREQAERALRRVLADEPEWEGMMRVVPVPLLSRRDWAPRGRRLAHRPCRTRVSRR